MPLPSPKGKQDKNSYISSCMGNNTMKSEFPKQTQRYAVCQSKWKKSKEYAKGQITWDDNEVDSENYLIY
jgi:hypothetical protein